MNILVTAIGSYTADIVIKTLQAGHHHVIGCDILPQSWIHDAYNVDLFVQAPRAADQEDYTAFIKNLCRQHDLHYIMPLIDVELDVFCAIKEDLQADGVTVCMSAPEITRLCRDKFRLFNFLDREKVCPVIPTALLAEAEIGFFHYPFLGKPRFGSSSKGVLVINTPAGEDALREIAASREYIIQPYIEGTIITVDVVREADDEVVCIARRELLRRAGIGMTVEIIENPDLNKICVKIANLLGITGAANFEFIETPRQTYLLEINPRFSGGVEFSHMAGYDVVTNHLRCFTGENIDKQISPKRMIITRKYEEYITKILSE